MWILGIGYEIIIDYEYVRDVCEGGVKRRICINNSIVRSVRLAGHGVMRVGSSSITVCRSVSSAASSASTYGRVVKDCNV